MLNAKAGFIILYFLFRLLLYHTNIIYFDMILIKIVNLYIQNYFSFLKTVNNFIYI
jgi:hypothetical protein